MVTREQRDRWDRDGYLALRGFFSPEAIDRVNAYTDELFRDPPDWLVADNTLDGRRGHLNDFSAEERAGGHLRLSALFRRRPAVRAVALDPRVRAILRDLFGEPAVLFCFAFLYIASRGGGTVSLDAMMKGGSKRR